MTIDELREVVRSNPQPRFADKAALSMAENPEGWRTWLAIRLDMSAERQRAKTEEGA